MTNFQVLKKKVNVVSDSREDISYEVRIINREAITCNCLGYTNYKHCKHSKGIKLQVEILEDKLIPVLLTLVDVQNLAKDTFYSREVLIDLLRCFYSIQLNSVNAKAIQSFRTPIVNYLFETLNSVTVQEVEKELVLV